MLRLLCWSLAIVALMSVANAQSDNCRGFIDTKCCCSNRCCFEIKLSDVEPLGADNYKIKVSGQVIKRTGWSPDGRLYRCACDQVRGFWVVHPTAKTHCLYLPLLGF